MEVSEAVKILFTISIILLGIHILISWGSIFNRKHERILWLVSLLLVSAIMTTTIVGIQINRNHNNDDS